MCGHSASLDTLQGLTHPIISLERQQPLKLDFLTSRRMEVLCTNANLQGRHTEELSPPGCQACARHLPSYCFDINTQTEGDLGKR